MPAKKNTLKVNKMTEPPKPPANPLFRFEVAIFFKDDSETSPGVDVVDVFAELAGQDDDILHFSVVGPEGNEEIVASFKDWTYFIRRESEADIAAMKLVEKFEFHKKTAEESNLV